MWIVFAVIWALVVSHLAVHVGSAVGEWRLRRRLRTVPTRRDMSGSLLLRWTAPVAGGLAQRWGARPVPGGVWLRRRLQWAGVGEMVQPADLWMQSLVWSSLAPLCLWFASGGRVGAAALAAAAAIGALMPWHWLRSTLWRRRRAIEIEFPRVIELIALSVHAGLELDQAVRRVTEALATSPLQSLLRRLQQESALGMGREAAWRSLAAHAGVAGVDQFVGLIVQGLRFGVPIAELLHAQAQTLRELRVQRIEARGAIASQQLLLPIVFCILPAYFCLVFGGLVARLFTTGIDGLWLSGGLP